MAVTLCGNSSIEVCAGRMTGGITANQKRTILDRLRGIPEVVAVYLEDRAHALEAAMHHWPESAGSAVFMADQIGESFRPPVEMCGQHDDALHQPGELFQSRGNGVRAERPISLAYMPPA
ncbi:hypothetical protein GCM10027161_20950 [Microbispora hainanensis]